jgi:translation initiation factor 1 (eIF-1/SUI1)
VLNTSSANEQNQKPASTEETKEDKSQSIKKLPGGKVKKKEESIITIARTQRNKRKCVTSITGLERFGKKKKINIISKEI